MLLGGKTVTKSYTNTEVSVILKDIIATYTTGFTVVNVNTTTTTTTIGWEDAPMWKVYIDLCNESGFDLYVDNTYDFHFFESNTIENIQEAIIEEDNLLSQEGLTNVTYDLINRVKVEGKDNAIIHWGGSDRASFIDLFTPYIQDVGIEFYITNFEVGDKAIFLQILSTFKSIK